MNKLIYHILFIGIIGSLIVACSHDTDTFDGPNLIDRFGDFNVVEGLGVSSPTVNFTAGETVFFTAQFNKNVDWVVQITGSVSGAVKRIEGFDRELNQENATWNGGTTDLPFFKAEMCTVELLIPEEPDYKDTGEVEVLGTKTYEGGLVTDFEEDPGTDLFIGNFEFDFSPATGRTDALTAAEGDFCLLLEGTDNTLDNFFVGLITVNASITGETYIPLPTTVPEEVFFNCFMFSDGTPYTIAVIEFAFDSNDSGAYEDGDATFKIDGDFPISWEGWRHINHPMSEVGISQEQLEKLVAIRFILISDNNAQPIPREQVGYAVDFVTFTQGAPLEL
jgi:hypothetical protein